MTTDVDPRLQRLVTLLQVESEARGAITRRDLGIVITNETRRVIGYRQAIFWRINERGRAEVYSASNVSDVDGGAPFVLWLNRLLDSQASREATSGATTLSASDLPDAEDREAWAKYLAPYVLLVPLRGRESAPFGGLLLASDDPWNDAHRALVEQLADTYSHAWLAFSEPERKRWLLAHLSQKWNRYAIIAVIVLIFPVRQYVVVPAEVVAREPFVVTAPMAGVVREILVAPNAQVSQGTPLFDLEATELRNAAVVSEKSLAVVEAEYLKNSQSAFSCDDCRARLPELAAQLERERARLDWARSQLERAVITAQTDGVAVFSDPNLWRGRPVSVGERVMQVADVSDVRLRIDMPVADAIAIDVGTDVVFYADTDPLNSREGLVSVSSYEAQLTPEQVLAYVLFAEFSDKEDSSRLGMKGTAKVYGGRAPVIYYLLRRPFSWIRRSLGV